MRKAIFSIVSVLLLCGGYSFGQRLTGGLSVQVTDPDGKSGSDVKASVVSKDRGNKTDVVSNSDGLIVVADLPPGDYKLTLQHDGFRTINADFTIRVGVTHLAGPRWNWVPFRRRLSSKVARLPWTPTSHRAGHHPGSPN